MTSTLTPRAAFGNTALRALTMASRFVLVVILARLLPPELVGEYGLIVAGVTFAVIGVGMDFYTHSTREMLGVPREKWPTMLRDQAVFVGFGYLVVVPLALALFGLDILPNAQVYWFLVLLGLEHLAQEMIRLLIIIGRPIEATAMLFLRHGLWVWVAVGVMWAVPATRDLNTVFASWTIGASISVCLGARLLADLPWRRPRPSVDWVWIRRGAWVAATYFIANLCYRAILILDRMVLDQVAGREILGVYTFYIGVATAISVFLDSAVIAFLYPRVVTAYQEGDTQRFRKEVRRMFLQGMFVTALLVVGAVLVIRPVVVLLSRPVYLEHLEMFWVLVVGMAVHSLGLVSHYGLYAMSHDRAILIGNAVGLVAFGVLVLLVGASSRGLGVAVALSAGLGAMAVTKTAVFSNELVRMRRTP